MLYERLKGPILICFITLHFKTSPNNIDFLYTHTNKLKFMLFENFIQRCIKHKTTDSYQKLTKQWNIIKSIIMNTVGFVSFLLEKCQKFVGGGIFFLHLHHWIKNEKNSLYQHMMLTIKLLNIKHSNNVDLRLPTLSKRHWISLRINLSYAQKWYH